MRENPPDRPTRPIVTETDLEGIAEEARRIAEGLGDANGRRCPSRGFLELDHRKPRALGGTDDASNLSVKCRAHNMLSAERDFGRCHIEQKKKQRKINPRQRWYGAEVALRALCAMGFKDREARRALAIVEQRGPNSQPPELETVLREALSFLA